MKLSFIALAASSIFWLAQALPTVQPPQQQGQDLLYFETRAEHDHSSGKKHSSSHHNSTHDSNSTSSGLVPGKYFDRVVIIVFENKDYDTTMKDKYFKSLPSKHNGKHPLMMIVSMSYAHSSWYM